MTELSITTTKLITYPVNAVVQAELEDWQEALEQYGMENKFGTAFSDATASLEYDKLPATVATAASQAWAAVMSTIKGTPGA